MLTPDERRGALIVLALLAIGTGWDVFRALRPPAAAPPLPGSVATAADTPATPGPAESPSSVDREPAPQPVGAPAAGRVISLNRATAAELDALPGIGPVLAARILEHRSRFGPFRSIEELRAVRGVGPRLLERLRDRVRTDP